MLKYIDVLIGLTTVLLVTSMCVTVLTQAITSLLNSRGKALKKGVMDLLQQIHPGFTEEITDQIATAVLTHPLIREGNKTLGTVVHREELTKLLLELATADTPQTLAEDAKKQLRDALVKNGISNPEQTIKDIRTAALELEKSHPMLANDVRHSMAILQTASSDFVAKIHGWFDQTIDRTSVRFTMNARWWTLLNAILVALFLQLDTVMVLNRLTVDDGLRAAMVQQAQQITSSNPDEAAKQTFDLVNRDGLVWIPQSVGDWAKHWNWNYLPGILVSMLLLNLGAPFWFNILKNLLQLRSMIAQKDDVQRKERQTSPDITVAGTPGRAPIVIGEKTAPPQPG